MVVGLAHQDFLGVVVGILNEDGSLIAPALADHEFVGQDPRDDDISPECEAAPRSWRSRRKPVEE